MSKIFNASIRYEEAGRTFEEAVKQNERDARVWLNLGRAFYESPGMRENSRAPLERVVSLVTEQLAVNPRDGELLADLADAHAMLGHGKQARALAARAVALAPGDAGVLHVAAGIDEMSGRRGDALAKLARALAAGYRRWEIERNPSLAALREDPRFAEMMAGSASRGERDEERARDVSRSRRSRRPHRAEVRRARAQSFSSVRDSRARLRARSL